jgi:VWFA-related protein
MAECYHRLMRFHARPLATAALLVAFSVIAPAHRFDTLSAAPSSVDGQQTPPQQTPAQQPPPQPPAGQRPPVIRSGINFVSVDVIVTDKKTGDVVLDMKQEDFEVREDKKPQQVETFDLVKIDALSAPAAAPKEIRNEIDEEREARQPNVRLFILFLDDYHVRRGNDLAVRRPLMDFIANQLAPQDMVAIMYPLTPVTALTFTRNRDSMISAINHFEGRKGLYEPRNQFEEKYAYYPAQQVEQVRNDVTMTALQGAAVKLGGMRDGRKSVIFVSEGFTATLPAQVNDPIAAMPRVGNRAPAGAETNDPRAESQKFFNTADLMSRMREVYDTFNRNNTSIYAVDPRGLAAFEYDVNQGVGLQTDRQNLNSTIDTLHVLADNTDGRAIVNRNDLATGMKQIMRDASGYYLLGYTSASAPTDGKFHSIEVRVKRPNVEVRARKGYWAYTVEDVARATSEAKSGPPPAIANALSTVIEPPTGGHSTRFWTGTDRGANGKSRVTFVWEPRPAQQGARADDAPSKMMVTATAPDGSPVFRGPAVAPEPDPANPTAPAGAAVTFDATPGQIEMRLVVENARGQVVDSTTQSLTVPDYSRTQISFGTPRVFHARTAREALLIRNNVDAQPSAAREFSRAERLLIRVDAYTQDGGKADVTARLLNRQGTAMSDVPVLAPEGKPLLIDVPLASLAAGEYVIELNAKSPSGTAQQLIGFKVGS